MVAENVNLSINGKNARLLYNFLLLNKKYSQVASKIEPYLEKDTIDSSLLSPNLNDTQKKIIQIMDDRQGRCSIPTSTETVNEALVSWAEWIKLKNLKTAVILAESFSLLEENLNLNQYFNRILFVKSKSDLIQDPEVDLVVITPSILNQDNNVLEYLLPQHILWFMNDTVRKEYYNGNKNSFMYNLAGSILSFSMISIKSDVVIEKIRNDLSNHNTQANVQRAMSRDFQQAIITHRITEYANPFDGRLEIMENANKCSWTHDRVKWMLSVGVILDFIV